MFNGVFTLRNTETDTDTERKAYVELCSHCSETDTKTDSHWIL